MRITVGDKTKSLIAKHGPTRTFGDYVKRQSLGDRELVKTFDDAWKEGLEAALQQSEPCSYEFAVARVKENQSSSRGRAAAPGFPRRSPLTTSARSGSGRSLER